MSHKKPAQLLALGNSITKNPDRARGDSPKPEREIGPPPDRLDADEVKAWAEVLAVCPAGVLTVMDRHSVEMVAIGLASLWRYDKDIRVCEDTRGRLGMMLIKDRAKEADRVFKMLMKFGMNPVDRSSVILPTEEKQSGFGGL